MTKRVGGLLITYKLTTDKLITKIYKLIILQIDIQNLQIDNLQKTFFIITKNPWIWIRVENFWILDPGPYNNLYESASLSGGEGAKESRL